MKNHNKNIPHERGLAYERCREGPERLNLYYLFEKDKQTHPMPPDRAEALRAKPGKILSNKSL